MGYRYGFNTQERDEDIAKGHYTAEYWEYDSRLGRRWNLDPVDQVWMSNYSVLMNCPVVMIDFWGDNPSPNNYEKSAINRAEKLSKKNPGYIVTLEKGNSNEEFIISIHKPIIKTTISLNTPKDNNILYEWNISQSTVGYKEVSTEIYKVGRWDKFVAIFGKGNATFSFGVVFTSKNGGNSNKFASILDPDGKFITVDEEIMSIFGSLKLKPENNNSVLTRSLNTGITKDKEGMDQTIRETANTSGESLGVKSEKEEYKGLKVLKSKQDVDTKDGKLYNYDSVTNRKGWIKFGKPLEGNKNEVNIKKNKL